MISAVSPGRAPAAGRAREPRPLEAPQTASDMQKGPASVEDAGPSKALAENTA